MTAVATSINVLHWAVERMGLSEDILKKRFPKLPLWLSGEVQPTLRQLEEFARFTNIPFGYFFLPQPPVLALPVPDFRTVGDETVSEPSIDLLDTLYLCEQRQDWYREYARLHDLSELSFVGSASVKDTPEVVAQQLRETLDLSTEARRQLPSWTDALRQLIVKAEDIGVMVMVSSVVGNNSHRKLNVSEFRGFTLVDKVAPLIFINGADSKAAQMFTLAHELAHVWLGETGVSDVQAGYVPKNHIERWCNQVAAELLIPLEELLIAHHQHHLPIQEEIQQLAREFKVSTLVVLRRLFDAGFITQAALWQHFKDEQERLRAVKERSHGGGDFYRSLGVRTSKRFARAVVANTLEGMTSFTEAFRMLGVRKTTTFYEAARELGVLL
jgi:Zn-dependent peptidase ImmA (M78 family)